MRSPMHPLRVILLVSLGIAAAIAWAFGSLLAAASRLDPAPPVPHAEVIAVSLLVFGPFLVPWSPVFAWAIRRASDIDRLTERSRQIAAGHYAESGDRAYHAELDDLGRTIEELRANLVRQAASFEEQRTTMEQIVASLGEGLLALGPRGKIVFANERVSEMFGSRGQLVGRSFLEVVRSRPLASAFDAALAGRSSAERTTLGTNGDSRQVEIRVFPVAAST